MRRSFDAVAVERSIPFYFACFLGRMASHTDGGACFFLFVSRWVNEKVYSCQLRNSSNNINIYSTTNAIQHEHDQHI